jgi:hypothetical protein
MFTQVTTGKMNLELHKESISWEWVSEKTTLLGSSVNRGNPLPL